MSVPSNTRQPTTLSELPDIPQPLRDFVRQVFERADAARGSIAVSKGGMPTIGPRPPAGVMIERMSRHYGPAVLSPQREAIERFAMRQTYPDATPIECDGKLQGWQVTLNAPGAALRFAIEFGPNYPVAHPEIRPLFKTRPCPHRFSDGTICWIDPGNADPNGRWNPARHNSVVAATAAFWWAWAYLHFLCHNVWPPVADGVHLRPISRT